MKKVLFISLLLITLSLPLFSKVAFGFTMSPVGEMIGGTKEGFGALSLTLEFSPWVEKHVFDTEIEVLLAPSVPFMRALSFKVSSPLYVLRKHPFKFIFPNPVFWAPEIVFGVQSDLNYNTSILLGLSPFVFQDPDYVYEFFSPYSLYNWKNNTWGWGIYIMRFSFFFEGRNKE